MPDPADAYQAWLAEATVTPRQLLPHLELLAEHRLMGRVIEAMEAETRALLDGAALRLPFWQDVVDFNGNFVHQCHRAKEDAHLIPAMVAAGILPPEQHTAITREHAAAKDLTLALADGVAEGDWERVQRLVSLYAWRMRAHMQHEEGGMLALAGQGLPPTVIARVRSAFDAVDQQALRGHDRRHFVAIANRLTARPSLF